MSTIVMLHGWGVGAAAFDDLSSELATRHRCAAVDLPGYGGAPPCEPYDLATLAGYVGESIVKPCHLVGWSLGAQVALCVARARPHDVSSIALIGATPCFVQREDWPCAMDPRVFTEFERGLEADPEATLERFVGLQALGDACARDTIQKLRALLLQRETAALSALAAGLKILRTSDLRANLGAIAQPALVLHGEHDPLVPQAAARFLAGALPAAKLSVMPGAAHAPFVSQPQAVGAILQEFFDGR